MKSIPTASFQSVLTRKISTIAATALLLVAGPVCFTQEVPADGDGHVRMNLGRQLTNISKGVETVASYPQFKNLPIIIGESDPEGCAACSVNYNPQNAYRNGTKDGCLEMDFTLPRQGSSLIKLTW